MSCMIRLLTYPPWCMYRFLKTFYSCIPPLMARKLSGSVKSSFPQLSSVAYRSISGVIFSKCIIISPQKTWWPCLLKCTYIYICILYIIYICVYIYMWNSFYLCWTECLPRLIYDEMMPLKNVQKVRGTNKSHNMMVNLQINLQTYSIKTLPVSIHCLCCSNM